MSAQREPTERFARDFLRRLSGDKRRRYLIFVEDHRDIPNIMLRSDPMAGEWMRHRPERIVGVYKGTEDLSWQDLAKAIDAVTANKDQTA